MIKWPDGLPFPLREGYGFKTVEPMARTSLQSGRARYRRNFSNVPVALEVSWLFTAEQARLFKGWYRDVLKDGVKWFECDLRTEEGATCTSRGSTTVAISSGATTGVSTQPS